MDHVIAQPEYFGIFHQRIPSGEVNQQLEQINFEEIKKNIRLSLDELQQEMDQNSTSRTSSIISQKNNKMMSPIMAVGPKISSYDVQSSHLAPKRKSKMHATTQSLNTTKQSQKGMAFQSKSSTTMMHVLNDQSDFTKNTSLTASLNS